MFVAEEDVGVWSFDALPESSDGGQLVAAASDQLSTDVRLVADVEGLAVYAPGGSERDGYLIVSSQGNDTYVVFDRSPPHEYRGTFQISLNGFTTGDTDGLEVVAVPVGSQYPTGLLVVQDGAPAWLGHGNQNFKLVSWQAVSEELALTD